MSLTTGRGPLGPHPAGRFNRPVPEGLVYVEPFPRRVRAMKDGSPVVDSDAVQLVHRPGAPPSYAFPTGDVRLASAQPDPEVPGHVRVAWDDVDEWYEEGERVLGHPRNPYHRIDCLRTDRRLRVTVGDNVLVDTNRTMGLYETGLAPRLYVEPALVRTDLLQPSPTTTYCPYKGTASHWSAVVGERLVADVAWSYADPYPESLPIKGLLSFYAERAEVDTDLPSR